MDAESRGEKSSEAAAAIHDRAGAGRQAARALRLGALAARYLRRRNEEPDDASRQERKTSTFALSAEGGFPCLLDRGGFLAVGSAQPTW